MQRRRSFSHPTGLSFSIAASADSFARRNIHWGGGLENPQTHVVWSLNMLFPKLSRDADIKCTLASMLTCKVTASFLLFTTKVCINSNSRILINVVGEEKWWLDPHEQYILDKHVTDFA